LVYSYEGANSSNVVLNSDGVIPFVKYFITQDNVKILKLFVYPLRLKKVWLSFKKFNDDVIIRRLKAVNVSKVLKNMHLLKTKLTSSRIFLRN
jgi:hypothetical protein